MKMLAISLMLGALTFLGGCTNDEVSVNPIPTADIVAGKKRGPAPEPGIYFDYTADEITKICATQEEALLAEIEKIASTKLTKVNKHNSLLALEQLTTDFNNKIQPLIFLGYSVTDENAQAAALACESKIGKTMVDIFTNENLYNVVKVVKDRKLPLDSEETFLLDETLIAFERSGLSLPKEKREEFSGKSKDLTTLSTYFSENLTTDKSHILVGEAELLTCLITKSDPEGSKKSAETFIAGLQKDTASGKMKVTTKAGDYSQLMENCSNAEIRKQLEHAYQNRGMTPLDVTKLSPEKKADLETTLSESKNLTIEDLKDNRVMMKKAIRLRDEMADLYFNDKTKTFADFALERRMAKTTKTVTDFLEDLKGKLKPAGEKDLAELRRLKSAETGTAIDDTKIESYDWRYYQQRWKEEVLNKDVAQGGKKFDLNQVRAYFPLKTVTAGMFEIYQTLLGVTFEYDPKMLTWHADVKGYRVIEDGETIAYFYMDLVQRKEPKYNHAAAFGLISGYRLQDGSYSKPLSSVISNFNGQKNNLLSHQEVETLFHEFGHIMHGILTRTRFGSFAGTSVKRDFVEAPSQMLENWCWQKETLQKLSGHVDTGEKLPDNLLTKLLELKDINRGIFYLRQLSFGTLDMAYHVYNHNLDDKNDRVDTTKIYLDTMKDVMLIPINDANVVPEASFGHLMGGYEAGYYGYLWSEVYAQDMFTKFDGKLLSPEVGGEYRKWILELGGATDAMDILRGFLGREPNNKAFLKSLGLTVPRMRVALVHDALLPVTAYGGTERVLWWLAKGLRELGHEVILGVRSGSQCPHGEVIPVDFSKFDEKKLPLADITHFFFPPPREPSRPYIATVHGNGKPGEVFPRNTNFLCADHAFRHGSETFVYNGVDPDDYLFAEQKGDYLMFLAKASWRVKNVSGAIHIARGARKLLRIVGGTRWWSNPWGWARWEGSIGGDAKARLLASASGLLFPVLWHEPFGLAVVEAMVSGTPVLGTPFGSLPELVGPACGRLCHSQEEFIEAAQDLGRFKPHEIREWALSRFHYHVMTKNYLKLYERVIAGEALNAAFPKALPVVASCQIPRRRS